jgi:hypothetical protein
MLFTHKLLAAAVIIGASHSTVSAQIAYEPTYSPPDLMALHNIKFNPVVNGVIERGSTSSNNADKAVSSLPSGISLNYTPSRVRTKSNLSAMAQRIRKSDPANAANMEKIFASGDVVGSVKGAMGRLGLDGNNVADVYAVYWVLYWGLVNQNYDAPSAGSMQAVARQAANGFSSNAAFAKMDNAEKQQAAEELMVMAAIFDASHEVAKSDPDLAEKFAKGALQGSDRDGLDLDKMMLTNDGFRPKGR